MKVITGKSAVIIISLIISSILVGILVGCSSGTVSTPPINTPTSDKSNVVPTWITPTVVGDNVTVSLDDVLTNINTHFKIELEKGNAYFMAYTYGDKVHVRADICPPCRSVSYTLVQNTLVCDSCKTVFQAKDGMGVRGACVNYPKASVPFETVDGKIVMDIAELTSAYEITLSPGLP